MTEKDFTPVYEALRALMAPHVADLVIKHDSPGNFYVVGPNLDYRGNEAYFGGMQIKKNYVSYHLMPVYMDPSLLDEVSEKLRKRMQGKSCFNFKQIDPELFAELEKLTEGCAVWFKEKVETWQY